MAVGLVKAPTAIFIFSVFVWPALGNWLLKNNNLYYTRRRNPSVRFSCFATLFSIGYLPIFPSQSGWHLLSCLGSYWLRPVLLYMKIKEWKTILRKPNNIKEVSYSVQITSAEFNSYNLARFVNTLSDMMQKYQSELLSDTSNPQKGGDASSISVFRFFFLHLLSVRVIL